MTFLNRLTSYFRTFILFVVLPEKKSRQLQLYEHEFPREARDYYLQRLLYTSQGDIKDN